VENSRRCSRSFLHSSGFLLTCARCGSLCFNSNCGCVIAIVDSYEDESIPEKDFRKGILDPAEWMRWGGRVTTDGWFIEMARSRHSGQIIPMAAVCLKKGKIK